MAQEGNKTEAQRRRNRVNRIKNTIIITIALWMFLSMIAIVVLIVQVARLDTKIKKVSESAGQTVLVDTAAQSPTEPATENTEDKYANVVMGIDSEDNAFEEGDTHKVYLTFDCVPSENTGAILDVLAQYNVKATFFVTGDESEEAAALYKRIVDEGHTLGMHSYSNQYSEIYSSTENFTADLSRLQSLLYNTTGQECTLYRFPGGSFNEITDINMAEFVHILNEDGITYYDWNVTAGDSAEDYSAEDVITNVTEGVTNYKTSVVLLHDTEDKGTTTESLGNLIESLKAMNAEILPIDDNTEEIQYIKAYSVE